MHNWYYYSNNSFLPFFGFGLFGFLIHVLFWGLVIMLIVKLVKGAAHHCGPYSDEESTVQKNDEGKYLDILKTRYAKGEITKKEFEQIKKDLV